MFDFFKYYAFVAYYVIYFMAFLVIGRQYVVIEFKSTASIISNNCDHSAN